MKRDNLILKIEILLVIILSACTFFRFTSNKIFIAFLLFILALALMYYFKEKKVLKLEKKKVLKVLIVFAILYIALFYMLGIYTGFVKNSDFITLSSLFKVIIPTIIIIITTELIRKKLLLNNTMRSKALIVVITTFIEVLLYINLYQANNLDNFLMLLGFITFASIANNMLYTYIASRYGIKPTITYRLITTLYIYLIPYIPDVYIFFRTFIRILYPLLIYLYFEKYYNKDKDKEISKDEKKQIVSLIVGFVLITSIIMVVSCKFYVGALVIGSKSMTGSINMGDVVVFVADKKHINKDDVIVFKKDDIIIVHRVVNKTIINDKNRYYTKGDANKTLDENFVTDDNLMGKVVFKIKYIGQPTLWLRNVFNKEG